MSAPDGVPGPVCVSRAFSSFVSMARRLRDPYPPAPPSPSWGKGGEPGNLAPCPPPLRGKERDGRRSQPPEAPAPYRGRGPSLSGHDGGLAALRDARGQVLLPVSAL